MGISGPLGLDAAHLTCHPTYSSSKGLSSRFLARNLKEKGIAFLSRLARVVLSEVLLDLVGTLN